MSEDLRKKRAGFGSGMAYAGWRFTRLKDGDEEMNSNERNGDKER